MALLPPEQARLAQVWASALNIDVNDIRPTDNFFDLGGDSLLAMRVMQQAEQGLGFQVEARRYVFENLAQLAVVASGTPVQAGAADTAHARNDAGDAAGKEAGHDGGKRSLLGRVFGGWSRQKS